MPTLYEITDEFLSLLDSDEPDFEAIERVNMSFERKIENYLMVIKELEAEGKKFSEEASRLSRQASSYRNRAKMLRERVQQQMRAVGKQRVDGELLSVVIQARGVKVTCPEPSDITEEDFLLVELKGDTEKAKREIEATGEIPDGFEAHVIESITIRTRGPERK